MRQDVNALMSPKEPYVENSLAVNKQKLTKQLSHRQDKRRWNSAKQMIPLDIGGSPP